MIFIVSNLISFCRIPLQSDFDGFSLFLISSASVVCLWREGCGMVLPLQSDFDGLI